MLTKDNHHSSYSPKFVAVRYLNIACNASKAAPTAMQMANPSDALASCNYNAKSPKQHVRLHYREMPSIVVQHSEL